jgi:hypothetical protein
VARVILVASMGLMICMFIMAHMLFMPNMVLLTMKMSILRVLMGCFVMLMFGVLCMFGRM